MSFFLKHLRLVCSSDLLWRVWDTFSPQDACLCNTSLMSHRSVSLKGKMIRRRTVTQPFQGDGRPCPALMEQSKPCPVKPCYRWQYGQWSPCQVQVSNPRMSCGNVCFLCADTVSELFFRAYTQRASS